MSVCPLLEAQYIVKPPRSPLSAFKWHRDSDWMVDADVAWHPYISVGGTVNDGGGLLSDTSQQRRPC